MVSRLILDDLALDDFGDANERGGVGAQVRDPDRRGVGVEQPRRPADIVRRHAAAAQTDQAQGPVRAHLLGHLSCIEPALVLLRGPPAPVDAQADTQDQEFCGDEYPLVGPEQGHRQA